MISTKRQIRTEKERYGGFAQTTSTATHSSPYYVRIEDDEVKKSDSISDVRTTADTKREDVVNNTVVKPVEPDVSRIKVDQPEYTAAPRAKSAEFTTFKIQTSEPVDAVPSSKTLKYAKNDSVTVEKESEARKPELQLSSSAKAMIAIGIVIAVLLAVAVITSWVVLGNTSARVDNLSQQVAQKQEQLIDQSAQIAALSDENALRQRAQELGMISSSQASNTMTVTLKEKSELILDDYSNGFDDFCDWLSSVLM